MKSVLITGGSRGIGEAMVREFADSGYCVWFTYHHGRQRAEALVDELRHHEVEAFYLELARRDSHERLVAALPGPVHVLVNNAGLGSSTVRELTADVEEQDAALMMVNAVGALWLTRELLPTMEQLDSAKIILLSSVGGGVSLFPSYNIADGMSKAALAYLGRHLQALYSRENIDVYTICPGATETPMFEASTLSRLDPAAREKLIDSLPGRRLISPAEIARLAVWLCTEDARVLRGAVLDASLGLGTDPRPLR